MDQTATALMHGLIQQINEAYPRIEATLAASEHRHSYYIANDGHARNPPEIYVYPKGDTQGFFRRLCSIRLHDNDIVMVIPEPSQPRDMHDGEVDIPGIGKVALLFGRHGVHEERCPLAAPDSIDRIVKLVGSLDPENIPSVVSTLGGLGIQPIHGKINAIGLEFRPPHADDTRTAGRIGDGVEPAT